MFRLACRAAMLAAVLTLSLATPAIAGPGILLLAHGGSEQWNGNVRALAEVINRERPVEIAFGMATRANIQKAIDALVQRGVTEIVAVPLFISSHSSVVTSTEYLLGLRAEAPKDLALFAKMDHGSGAPGTTGTSGHEGHTMPPVDGTKPIVSPVPVRMTTALDSHPIVAKILADRARAISKDPAHEAIILVAHGPVGEEENRRWLTSLSELAQSIGKTAPYATIDYMTVRDDAPPEIRNAATAELRALVDKRRGAGSRVLLVPVLLSFGGIEQGIRKRLEGLDYVMAPQAVMPDPRLVLWVIDKSQAK